MEKDHKAARRREEKCHRGSGVKAMGEAGETGGGWAGSPCSLMINRRKWPSTGENRAASRGRLGPQAPPPRPKIPSADASGLERI